MTLSTLYLGISIKIIYLARIHGKNQSDIFKAIVSPVNGFPSADQGTIGHLLDGASEFSPSSDKERFQSLGNEVIIAKYYTDLLPLIDPEKQKLVVLAFKEIISRQDVPSATQIGVNTGYTKQNIAESTSFDFLALLTALVKYSFSFSNVLAKPFLKTIGKDFLEQFRTQETTIVLSNEPARVDRDLSFTAEINRFKQTFKEVSAPCSLQQKNPSMLKTYQLDVSNNRFSIEQISNFVRHNIGNYVFSRTEIEKKINENEERGIDLDAIFKMNKETSKDGKESNFASIMTYSFLECALCAPKIESAIELNENSSGNRPSSVGVHMLPAGALGESCQIVFGAANIGNSITQNVDHIFDQIKRTIDHREDEYTLIDRGIFDQKYDKETSEYLRKKVIPSTRNDFSIPVDEAFGAFIGYTVDVPKGNMMGNMEYRQALQNVMRSDIVSAIPYIQTKIKESNLESYSFYFFFLPLNSAKEDAEQIMDRAFPGLGGSQK
jgi:hypothetical protein